MLQHLKLRNELFWDIDPEILDEEKNKRLIIERVINLGNSPELQNLVHYYGKKEVINTICNLNYIDSKTLNFFSMFFNVPRTNFKCYIRKQSIKQPWTY